MQNGMALREVGRYYDAAKGDRDITFEALKRTCVFRQQYWINLIRSCFGDSLDYKDDKDTRLAENDRALISTDLSVQPMFVKAGIYMLERAVAVTESLSRGAEQIVYVVLDDRQFKCRYAPNRNTFKCVFNILQEHYCQRLNILAVLDPPLWLSALYAIIKTFLDQRMRDKFHLAQGSKTKKDTLKGILKSPSDCEADAVKIVGSIPFPTPVDGLLQSESMSREGVVQTQPN